MELPQPTCDFIGEEPEEEEACNEVCGLSQGSTQASEVVAPWCQWRDLDFDWNVKWREVWYDIKYEIMIWNEMIWHGMIYDMIYDMNWYEKIVVSSLTTSFGHVEAYLPCQSSSHWLQLASGKNTRTHTSIFHVLLSRFDSWDAWC